MLTFETRIAGIPCQCKVITLTDPQPMRVYGPSMEDADPPEPGEIEFEVLDRKGYPAAWLANKLVDNDIDRLYEEAAGAYMAELYDVAY